MRNHALLILFLLAMSSCTIVQVNGANPVTSFHFGVLKLEPAAGAGSLSYRSRGFGLVPGLNGVTIGFAREDTVIVFDPDDCRTVVFDAPSDELLSNVVAAGGACRPGGGL